MKTLLSKKEIVMKLENKHISSPKSALLGSELTVTVHHDDPETFTLPPPPKRETTITLRTREVMKQDK